MSSTKLWKKILLLAVTVVVLLGAAELTFRAIFPSDPEDRWSQHHFRVGALGFSELNEIMEPDPDLFWRVKPDLEEKHVSGFIGTETFLSFLVTTDARGMRKMNGPDTEDGLVFLGDSCTFGIGVQAKETCAHLTGNRLGMRVDNLSCPGYTIFQGRKLFERIGRDPGMKALVVGFGFNDRLMWDGLTDPDQAKLLTTQTSFLARKSRFICCIELAVKGSLRLLKKKTGEKARRVPPELFRIEAERLIEKASAPVIFLFWPRIEWMNEPGTSHPYIDPIKDLADGKTVAILDLAEAFRKNGGERLYLDGIHATPEGHRVAAGALSDLLKEMIP
jgi:hypothetical protein